jgi:hypothetical protein
VSAELIASGFQEVNSESTFLSPCYKMFIFKLNRRHVPIFFVFRKSDLMKSCSFSEDLSEYKISLLYVDWYKFHSHRKSLNVRHFGMVSATELKIMASRSSSMAWPAY